MIPLKKREEPQRQLLDAAANDPMRMLHGFLLIVNIWFHFGVKQNLLERSYHIFYLLEIHKKLSSPFMKQ